jgi:hypothetical protein
LPIASSARRLLIPHPPRTSRPCAAVGCLSSLRGDQAWERAGLVEARRASVTFGLPDDYLDALLDTFDRRSP